VGNILLVEAEPATSDAWAAALLAAGHAVLTAAGMREALSMVRDGGIDVVVIDVYDPRAGLLELARGMNALPDAPPIVLVSESPAAPSVSVRIGASMFVPKPCEPGEVVLAIDRLLRPSGVFPAFDEEPTRRTWSFHSWPGQP
jgi:two-component system OmpR family response regulator